MWFKNKHGKGSCEANRHKDLGECSFVVPQQVRDTLAPSVAPEAAAAMAHSPNERFVDPTDWETEFFSELGQQKIFSSSPFGTLQSLPRDTRTLFSTLSERPGFTSPGRKKEEH